MKVLEFAIDRISNSVLGYYHLWAYLDASAKRILAGRATHRISTSLEFYQRVFRGEIKHGDRVILKEFFVTEWIPRAAGGIASLVETKRLNLEDYGSLSKLCLSKSSYLQPGDIVPPFGSSRLPVGESKRIALGAVSAREYHTDLGLVLSVTDSVYSEFLSKQYKHFAVEASLEGYVEFYDSPPSFSELPVDSDVKQSIKNLSTPKYVVRVDSPLQMAFKTHDTHPRLNAWVIRRIGHEEHGIGYEYLHLPLENDVDEFRRVTKLIYHVPFFANIEEVRSSFAQSTKTFLGDLEFLSKQEDQIQGITEFSCLTEFDGRSPLIEPLVPIRIDPRKNPSTTLAVEKYISEARNLENKASVSPYHRHKLSTTSLMIDYDHEYECHGRKVSVPLQIMFGEKQPVQEGRVSFPANNELCCPACGGTQDLSELRRTLERRFKTAIVS